MSTLDDAAQQRISVSYGQALDRVKAAARRATAGDGMRRAALAEIGTAIRDHRAVLEEEGQTGYLWRLRMEDAEEMTGISRRTLSGCLKAAGRTDQDLAQEALEYRDGSRACMRELHTRHPELDGYVGAWKAVWEAADAAWQAEHASEEETFEEWREMLNADLEQPEAVRVIRDAYWARIQVIADGGAPKEIITG